jgi:hypothetical protein
LLRAKQRWIRNVGVFVKEKDRVHLCGRPVRGGIGPAPARGKRKEGVLC